MARLHVAGIREGFLSGLGPRFLSHLYARIVRQPGCFLLVAAPASTPNAVEPATVAGFVAGSEDVRRLYRSFVLRDGVGAAISALPRLITALPRVVETLRHGGSGDEGSGRGPELLSIAVDPAARGRGLGRALVDAFQREVVARGGDAAHVVVGADNASAVRLYRQAGFVEVRRFELHPGTPSLLLQWNRTPAHSGPGGTGTGTGPRR